MKERTIGSIIKNQSNITCQNYKKSEQEMYWISCSDFLYVFVNKSGSLSLATPNYAGNVEEKDADVMLEYLPR